MPRRKTLVNNEIYHVIIRGVADMPIFKNDQDRFRMIFSLYEFNNDKPITIRERRKVRKRAKRKNNRGRDSVYSEKRDLFVEILSFCFMPNHMHLLLKQIKDDGVSKFMRKLGTGYAGYFNKKHDRKGYFFQGRFKSVHIQNEHQLRVVFSYIHINPISLIESDCKEREIRHFKKTIKFLENYKWSSYLDYIGKDNFPSVIEKSFLSEVMGGKKGCISFVNDWIKHKVEIKKFTDILLE